ncbi:MAG: alpha/beta hydrolase [Actinomycetota bacterium]|nr:alpha/beta hydrolase [Actinomycetota bacterium]
MLEDGTPDAPGRPRSVRRVTALVVLAAAVLLGASCEPSGRYFNEVFSSVSIIRDLQYGAAPDEDGRSERLLLDLYQPDGDDQARRPAIVWVHGGGFTRGDKSAQSSNATTFAKRGYVTVSINYRLRSDNIGLAINDAQHDAQAAVRWLRRYANRYRIDAGRIAIGGSSAGAITALYVGNHREDPGTSGNAGFGSSVRAAVSISGFGGHYSSGDPPAILFHGTQDSTLPYSLAVDTCEEHRRFGNVCELRTYQGAGHGLYPTYQRDIQDRTAAFLFRHLDLP